MLSKHKMLIGFVVFAISLVQPQEIPFDQTIEDAFEELGGKLTLYFFNALDGNPIDNAMVKIKGVGDYTTDAEGKIRFPIPENENQKLKVSFRSRKFVPSDFEIELIAGTIFQNRFSVSPSLDIKHIRIVLDWGATPNDLDAHFVKKNDYHVSYRNKKVTKDGSGILDRDDMNGFGPETITIKKISGQSEYEYFVYDFSDRNNSRSKNLSKSRATVKVFGEGRLMEMFRVPQDNQGIKWNVFKIRNGEIVDVNRLTQ